MTVPCQLTNPEMREAIRLNRTPSFWVKAALGNMRALLYLAVFLTILIVRYHKSGGHLEPWRIIPLALVIVLFLLLYLLLLNQTITKRAQALNAACHRLVIDAQGVAVEGENGASSFTPWTDVHRWQEGTLVFTLGDAKAFRTVSKRALGPMQTTELRSLLKEYVR